MDRKICSRCIMDTSVPDITFDNHGICNYCYQFEVLEEEYPLGQEGQKKLEAIIEQIKRDGAGKPYDCVIGVSGGTDSTFALLKAVEYGLRPLAVHFDNGWNTEISVSNIYNALNTLGVDLETYVVDWEEFRDIQLSFLKASVPEVEMPTDLGIRSILYKKAAEIGVKYIISGTSFRAEGIVPKVWGYKDGLYIKSVQNRFGSRAISTFPNLLIKDIFYYSVIKRIRLVRLLNYLDYDKQPAKRILSKDLGWTDYGAHHGESVYTRFFQYYLAPYKFNMDRRKVTASALIRRGRLRREEGMAHVNDDSYMSELFEYDKRFIAKKFRLSEQEFESILSQPPKTFKDYRTYYPIIKKLNPIIKFISNVGLLRAGFQGD